MDKSEVGVRFAEALAATEMADDRDSKVEQLRKALSLRPDHPGNLAIEFAIGIELSQRNEPRPAEALAMFEHILVTYRHMDYYSTETIDDSESMQFMVPKAGILAACIARGPDQNPQKAQEYLWRAMEQMNETYQKRIEDWKNSKPREESPLELEVFSSPLDESKRESRKSFYEQRRIDAANGDVFGLLEMATVRAAVRQYGYSHGPHRPEVAIVVMREIIDRFPGTPMAKVAQGHIDKAMTMLNQELLDDLADKILYTPPPEPNTATQPATPTPSPGRDSKPKTQDSGLVSTIADSVRTHPYTWLASLVAVVIVAGIIFYARKRRR